VGPLETTRLAGVEVEVETTRPLGVEVEVETRSLEAEMETERAKIAETERVTKEGRRAAMRCWIVGWGVEIPGLPHPPTHPRRRPPHRGRGPRHVDR
jgi:hypothetical protein